MTITYTYTIAQMNIGDWPDPPDTVCETLVTLTGTDGTYSGTTIFPVAIPHVPGSEFTPYAQLTEAECLSWVMSILTPDEIALHEADVNIIIDNKKNPPPNSTSLPLPWPSQYGLDYFDPKTVPPQEPIP